MKTRLSHPKPLRLALGSLIAGLGLAGAFALGRASALDALPAPETLSLASVLSKNPLTKDEPFRILPLVQGQDASVSLVRAQGELKPHYHEGREEIAYIVRGGGTMLLGDQKRAVKAGDMIYLPRHTVHGFSNGSKGETVILSLMSPPFDGKDRHFLEEETPH